jgi:hypothetical protein
MRVFCSLRPNGPLPNVDGEGIKFHPPPIGTDRGLVERMGTGLQEISTRIHALLQISGMGWEPSVALILEF